MKFINSPLFKWIELILVFIGLPLIYYYNYIPFHKSIPLLVIFFLFLVVLLRDKKFDSRIFGFNKFSNWRPLLLRFLVFALISLASVYFFSRDFLFILPKERFTIWLLILVLYPLWSAYPQELIYRAYFFHRYRNLVKQEWLLIGLNAILFSFSHIIFKNLLAIVLTLVGGVMFALTYKRSNSLMVVFTEHMLYGNWIFTVGIGQYFYAPMVNS